MTITGWPIATMMRGRFVPRRGICREMGAMSAAEKPPL
jgi:hypothetical protein